MKTTGLQRSLVFAALLGLTSCAVPTKKFFIDAVDIEDKKVKCLVVLDSDWPGEGAKKVYYTPTEIEIPFKSKVVYVQVKPATLGPDGDVTGIPKETDPSEYKTRGRDLQIDYPAKITFILERN